VGLNYGDLFEDWEVALAKSVVFQFQSKYPWLTTLGIDDLLQECLTHWYMKRFGYRPGKGASLKTYMATMLNHKLYSLMRREISDKRRSDHLSESLERPLDENGATLADSIAADMPDMGLRLDVRSAINELTPLQKRICQLLQEGYPVTEIARMLRKPRHAIRQEISWIRQTFLRRGLDEKST